LNALREMLRGQEDQDLEGFDGDSAGKRRKLTLAVVAKSVQTAINCTTSGAVGVVTQAIVDAIVEVRCFYVCRPAPFVLTPCLAS
jgi:hypothetical protein